MNQAFSRVTAEHTIFLDGDCIPLTNFVAHHVIFFEPRCILAGPRILASKFLTARLERGEEILEPNNYAYWMSRIITPIGLAKEQRER